jgi:hypothetical protein
MSRNVSVVITDDLDGSEGAETVSFGLDGVSYEIDLGEANRAKLEGGLAPFVAAGRRSGRSTGAAGGKRRSSGRPSGPSTDRTAVRVWAREAGLNVSERGRISSEVMKQFEAAH